MHDGTSAIREAAIHSPNTSSKTGSLRLYSPTSGLLLINSTLHTFKYRPCPKSTFYTHPPSKESTILQRRHKRHTTALPPINTLTPHMLPQHLQHLTSSPPPRHRSIRRLEITHCLRPLPRRRLAANKRIRLVRWQTARAGGTTRHRGIGRGIRLGGFALRGPVVYVPVVFVEELVVFGEEGGCHGGEVGFCKC